VQEIFPLPRFNVSQPGNIFRIFEKGGTKLADLGNPDPNEAPGRPFRRLGERGLGTFSRVAPVIIGAHKTRLHDPLFVNPYLGYTWWDQESDAEFMYPKEQRNPTDEDFIKSLRKNPEAAAARGLWGDVNFLEKTAELNPKLKETQFADHHGHGWVFRGVFKKDREGNLLTLKDEKIPTTIPTSSKKPCT
jgi:hypothetical protein